MIKEIIKSTIVQIFVVFFLSSTLIALTTRANDDYGIFNDGSWLIIITVFISTVVYSLILAEYDESKTIYQHGSRLAFRFVLLTFFPFILSIQSGNWLNLLLALNAYTIFYIFFELFLNNFKGEPSFYVGTMAVNDKFVRIINKIPIMSKLFPGWYVAVKFILYVLSMYLLIRLWL